jgi:hypothetical protein
MEWYPTTLAGTSDDTVVRMEGIDYHRADQMVVNTGEKADLVNVRGSSGTDTAVAQHLIVMR